MWANDSDAFTSQEFALPTQTAAKTARLVSRGQHPMARNQQWDRVGSAGTAHGNRGAGEGAPWNFAVSGQGTVISANLTSRARKAGVDTTGDGTADVTLLLGPVIAGTSLRDVAPFYKFGDFRDQIEFAQLARALNDKLSPTLTLPSGDITGKHLTFTGVVPLKSATDAFVVTAVSIKVDP